MKPSSSYLGLDSYYFLVARETRHSVMAVKEKRVGSMNRLSILTMEASSCLSKKILYP